METAKLIITIPKAKYQYIQELEYGNTDYATTRMLYHAVKVGTPLDSAEIEKKCDRINSIASVLSYPQHREIQELLCEILASIGNAESKDPNDLTHMFDGVTEIPKDAFKGWTTEKLLEQIRKENNDNPEDTGCDHND